jgi:uncharacterized protein
MSVPAQISASRALARDERYAGPIDAAELPRLSDLAPREMRAELRIHSEHRRGWLEGRIEGLLRLECQVCSTPFDWRLAATVKLALARDEAEEERLMADCEPLLVQDDRLMLHEVVEDEVLLALPMMPRCGACENARPPSDEAADEKVEETRRPLAALKNLNVSKGASPARRK